MVNIPKSPSLPSWIPPGLIEATQQQAKQSSADIVWLPSLEDIKKIPQRAPSSSTASLLSYLWYHKVRGIYKDFQGKNVLDIWGGFWWIAPSLCYSAQTITVVDPVFQEKDLEKLLAKNLKDQEEIMWLRKDYLARNRDSSNAKTDICEAELVFHECSWWENYTQEDFPNVRRNSSYGEKLVWVDDNSQDVIFLNFILSKSTANHKQVIQEVYRVLKTNGIVIVSDNDDEKWFLYDLSKFFDVEIKHQDKMWLVAVCIKK